MKAKTNPLLAGVRVLDLTRLLPGPFCTLYLAQLGAEVIKIEEPNGGDYARGTPEMFNLVNRGKKSVTLDLRQGADREHFLQLVETADVVLESFRPGVMDKLGCSYEVLRKRNPRLVYAAISGYGQTGPYRDWAGHDMNYLGIAGVLDQIGTAGGAPALSNVQIADLAGGALTGAIGVLAAVLGARSSGQGSFVDVSMTDGSLALQVLALSTLRSEGLAPRRGADLLTGSLPNYNVYRCRDGKYLAVGALEPKFFKILIGALVELAPAPLRRGLEKALGKSAGSSKGQGKKSGSSEGKKDDPFATLNRVFGNPRRARRLTAPIRWALGAVFLTRSRDEWTRLLADRDACVTPILDIAEAVNNEQIRARGMIVDDGGKPAFDLPIRFSEQPASVGPAPQLGEHTAEVLERLTAKAGGRSG